jgi:hypothetical protein
MSLYECNVSVATNCERHVPLATAPFRHKWTRPGMPHCGWSLVSVEDLGHPAFKCEACGTEEVRYIHHLAHAEHPDLVVGCVCAEKLTADIVGPRKREQQAKNRAMRRTGFVSSPRWRTSSEGDLCRRYHGWLIRILKDKPGNHCFCASRGYDEPIFSDPFVSVNDAKYAAFDAIEEQERRS